MAESPDHITCRELVEQVTDYFEGALSADEVELLEQHVNFCQGCAWYVDEMRTTIEAGERLGTAAPPRKTLELVLDAFRHRGPS